MPPRITVEFLGDSRSLEDAYKRTSDGANRFGRDVQRASTIGSQSFDRLGKSATTATGRMGRMSTAFGGVASRSTYAGYRVQNLVTNIQSISRESKTAAGSVNILLQSLGLFGVIGAGVAATALGLAKGAQALSGLAGRTPAGSVVGDRGSLAQMKALLLANQFGGQLTLADVAGPISSGLLTVEGLRTLRPRFTSQQAFRLSVGFAREVARQQKLVPRRREVNPQQGRSFPQFVQPLTQAQQLKVSLANDPNNVAFLRQKIAQDRAAIAFATKQRQQLKLTNEEFIAVYQSYYADINATTAQIALIAERAKKKVVQSRVKLPSDVSGQFSLNDLSAFRGGILPGGRVSGQFQKLLGSFEAPIGLRIAEARAGALGDDAGVVSALKREAAAARKALKSGRLSSDARLDAWNLIGDINDRLKNQSDGDVSNFRKVGARALAKGLGLSGAAERTLIARLSQVGPGGTVHGSGQGAFGLAGGGQSAALRSLFVLAQHAGLVSTGNIDLLHRKVARLAGGGIATVKSLSIGTDLGETLIPSVINGKVVSQKAAIAYYRRTGQNLGTFSSVGAANRYAERLHLQQERFYGGDIYLDGHKVETAVTKRQQTRRRRNPTQKRGQFAGPH